jgi:hypothetical protein
MRFLTVVGALAIMFARADLAAAQRSPETAVAGVVFDSTGGVLPDALVQLLDASGGTVQTGSTDSVGAFRFDGVRAGRYEVRANLEGFRPATVRVVVGNRAPAPLKITLALAGITQEVTVTDAPQAVDTRAASNSDALTINQDALASLPVFDQDVIRTVSQFLDAGSIGTAGVTLIVNGMEVNSLGVSASAIQQIKINADPYSAEYGRPGRGRIEILTKPGGQTFHGETNGTFRDAALDARNAFATSRPAESRRIFEGSFGGPLGRGGKSAFMLSAQDDTDNQQLFVFAHGLSGDIRDTAPVANRHRLLSGSLTFQPSERTTISIRPSYEYTSNPNRGVGGTTLATAGWTYEHTEDDLTYLQQTVLNAGLINQFQVLIGYEHEPTISASPLPAIVVDGAFKGGGAQNTLLRTERHIQASQSLTWTHGHHLTQVGVQVPDWSWRGFDDQTNVGGTFYFADLPAYAAGTPYAFTEQQGNGKLTFLDKQVGAYVKDDWQVRPDLTISMGLRYDWSNAFLDNNNVAPRLSAAYSIGKRDVIRAGGGVFYDRVGAFPVVDVLHSRPGGVQRLVITNPAYPTPFGTDAGSQVATPSITQFDPDIRTPYTFQYSLGLEHELVKGTTLAVTYTGSRGSILRSRDINAPRAPLYLERPDAAYGQIRQIESTGRQRSDSMQVTLRGKVTRWFNGQLQYVLSRSLNDSDGVSYFPSNDYDFSGEWARASFDRRHRFVALGRMTPGRFLDLGIGVTLQSGAPYTAVLPGDPFDNGRGGARPADGARNGLQGVGYADVDLRTSRDISFGSGTQKRTVTIALDGFNILNRVNDSNYVGTINSPLFGQPVAARAPRQLQLSARIKF